MTGRFSNLKDMAAKAVIASSVALAFPTHASADPKHQREAVASAPYQPLRLDTQNWTPEQSYHFGKISDGLKAANLPLPRYFIPFPDKQVTGDDGVTVITKQDSAVIGAARTGAHSQSVAFFGSDKFLGESCPRSIFKNQDHYERLRILVLAHETGHYIDEKLHLTDHILDGVGNGLSAKDREILKVNVGERMADMTATIYALGNMSDAEQLVREGRFDYRLVNIHDVDHNTATSIGLAAGAYRRAAHPNISIVDAAKWSAQLLAKQKNDLVPELFIAKDVNIGMATLDPLLFNYHLTAYGLSLAGVPDGYVPTVQKWYEARKKARAELCGYDPNTHSPLSGANPGLQQNGRPRGPVSPNRLIKPSV